MPRPSGFTTGQQFKGEDVCSTASFNDLSNHPKQPVSVGPSSMRENPFGLRPAGLPTSTAVKGAGSWTKQVSSPRPNTCSALMLTGNCAVANSMMTSLALVIALTGIYKTTYNLTTPELYGTSTPKTATQEAFTKHNQPRQVSPGGHLIPTCHSCSTISILFSIVVAARAMLLPFICVRG